MNTLAPVKHCPGGWGTRLHKLDAGVTALNNNSCIGICHANCLKP